MSLFPLLQGDTHCDESTVPEIVAMTAQLPDQVFIVGMNGSGTTMLLDHLASHSLLFGFPAETQVLPYFIKRQAIYGDLEDDANYRKLWCDMAKSSYRGQIPGASENHIPEHWREQPRSAAGVFNAIMLQFADAEGKRIWCEKTPMHVHHLALLAQEFPTAKFIHIVRDGRDCAASFHRRWSYNPVRTIYRWKHAVRAGQSQGQRLDSRYYEVRYDEVTRAPENAFQDICAFLGIPFESSVLNAIRVRPHMTGSASQSIVRNQRCAAQYFTPRDLEKIERVAGRCLSDLGYATSNPTGDQDPKWLTLRWWELVDDVRRLGRLVLAEGSMFKPKRWSYIIKRARGALKQKISMRP